VIIKNKTKPGFWPRKKLSEIHRMKISKSIKKSWKKIGYKKKLSEAHKGIIFSNDRKKNISNALKGRVLTQEWKDKIKKTKKGTKLTKQHKTNIKLSLEKVRKIKPKFNVTKIVKHHIYLKENSDETIKFTRKKHRQLHARAYDYIYYKYGKKGINNYLKWFKENY